MIKSFINKIFMDLEVRERGELEKIKERDLIELRESEARASENKIKEHANKIRENAVKYLDFASFIEKIVWHLILY